MFNLTETKFGEILENPGYREVFIPKRKGGQRRLLIPGDELKSVQRHLLRYLEELSVGRYAHGFHKERNIVTNAQIHSKQKAILHTDIRDFFPSITPDKIRAMISARPDVIHFLGDKVEEFIQVVTHEGHTPQGCPTSPHISNMCMVGFDQGAAEYVRMKGCKYSRYADDITVSLSRGTPKECADTLWKFSFWIEKALREAGFEMARDKTYIMRCNKRMKVTGLVVNSQPKVDRDRMSRLRGLFHKAKKMIEAGEQPNISLLRGELGFATISGFTPSWSLKNNIMFVEDKCNTRLKNFGWRPGQDTVAARMRRVEYRGRTVRF
jgi:RNA-directed DNA polymerase